MNLINIRIIFQISILLICCLVPACDNIFNKPIVPEHDDMVLVYFGSSDVYERSVLPDISLNNISVYKLYGAVSANPDQNERLLAKFEDSLDNASVYIKSGQWNLTLEVYDKNDYLVLRGINKNIYINAGDSETVHFSLLPVKNYEGTAIITIKLPNENSVYSIDTVIEGETLNPPLEIKDGIIQFSKIMTAGDYLVNFFLKDSEGEVLAVITEMLVIRSNLESVKTITLTGDDFNVPSIPSNIRLNSVSTITASLSWDVVNIANNYIIYRSQSENGIYSKINIIAINGTEFTDYSVKPDTTYYYKVSAINGNIEGLQSVSIPVSTLSSIPTNIQVTYESMTRTEFVWDAVIEASNYNIYRSDDENGIYEKINTIVVTKAEFTDTTVSPDRDYFYRISAVFNGFEGEYSSPISATTLSSIPVNIYIIPESISTIRVSLMWDAIIEASSYNIYRSDSEYGIYEKVNAGIVTETEFTDESVLPDKQYFYKIRAIFNNTIYGLQSERVHINTLSAIPDNVSIPLVSATRVSLVWDAVVEASGYNIYRSDSKDGIYEKVNAIAVTETEFTDTGLTGSTEYFYQIHAVFGSFEGLGSIPISVNTIASSVSMINFEFIDPSNFEPSLPNIQNIIKVTEDRRVITIITTGNGWSNNYQWYLNGVKIAKNHLWYSKGIEISITGDSIEINWQLPVGHYELAVVATRDNIPYSASATFKVLNTDNY